MTFAIPKFLRPFMEDAQKYKKEKFLYGGITKKEYDRKYNKGDIEYEKLYKLYHNRVCLECNNRAIYRNQNSLTCKCGKLRFDPIRKEVKQ